MKLDKSSSEKLRSELRRCFRETGATYSGIGEIARVHPSQVSRICRGGFKTLSHNVVQVCKALGIKIESVKLEKPADDAVAQRLKRSVLDVWDQTPADAERLVRFLRELAKLRHVSRSNPEQ